MLNQQEFLKRANILHNNIYDYSKSHYVNMHTKVCIICSKHGEFWQRPADHLNKKHPTSCPTCSLKRPKMNTEKFIKKAQTLHHAKYSYDKTIYKGSHTKVCIICPVHGDFFMNATNHLSGQGCPKCGISRRKNNQKMTEQKFRNLAYLIHDKKYSYEKDFFDNYSNQKSKVKITCPVHGDFYQSVGGHINMHNGCPKCTLAQSHLEEEVGNFLTNILHIQNVITRTKNIIKPLELDIYLPDYHIAIEVNGLYWHSTAHTRISSSYHLNKTTLCEEKGIHLIHIYEDDWNFKQDIVKSRLQNLLQKDIVKIAARKCQIKLVNRKEEKQFNINNHLKGHANSSLCYGLFYNKDLISIMSFCKPRYTHSNKNQFELLRFSCLKYTTVHGAASKLFKHFVKNHNPEKIFSFADRSWTSTCKENVYMKLGFSQSNISHPNYWYFSPKEFYRQSRLKFQKHKLIKKGYEATKTEKEIMKQRGYLRIFDSGQICLEWNKKISNI